MLIEGFCAIGVIGGNRRQVWFNPALAGAYRAKVEQDQTLIQQTTPISQKLRGE